MARRSRETLLALALLAGCGSRSGLFVADLGEPTDGGFDAHVDASTHDQSAPDALPGIDASRPDGGFKICPDAGATLVYVITAQDELFSFYPPSASFQRIGPIACPTRSTPFSMAVDRNGVAYSVFLSGELFRISTATAACIATPYAPSQMGWTNFGMGYAADTNDAGESLFVAQIDFDGGGRTSQSKGLGAIDTRAFRLGFIGPFNPIIPGAELTGTGDGRLFAFYTGPQATGSHIAEIDKTSGRVLSQDTLRVGTTQDAFAFAYWGGEFWIFTSSGINTASTVTRYDLATKTETTVTTAPNTIVGAGVSTCAPAQ